MACTSPITVINPRYRKLAEQAHVRVGYYSNKDDYRITVPCGHCMQCLRKRTQNWFLRAHHVYKRLHLRPQDCYFCTFTLDPKVYKEAVEKPYVPVRQFIDRLRKHSYLRKRGIKMKFPYFFVVEFADGETARKRGFPSMHRMHYHAIFFGCPLMCQTVAKAWRDFMGIAKVEKLRSEAGVYYTLKYVTKDRKVCQEYLSDVDVKKNGKLYVSHRFGSLSKDDIREFRKRMLVSAKSFFSMAIGNYLYSIPRYWKSKCFIKPELEELHEKYVPPLLWRSVLDRFLDRGKQYCRYVFEYSCPMHWLRNLDVSLLIGY